MIERFAYSADDQIAVIPPNIDVTSLGMKRPGEAVSNVHPGRTALANAVAARRSRKT